METREIKKITCPNCCKTGNYTKIPNYCAYCGAILKNCLNNQNKLISNHNKDNI